MSRQLTVDQRKISHFKEADPQPDPDLDREPWETDGFFEWLENHDRQRERIDRRRRLKRQGASETQLQAEALAGAFSPGLTATRLQS